MQKLLSYLETGELPTRARRFFDGRLYPAVTCLIVLIGSATGSEFFFNVINVLMMCGALIFADSILSLLVPFVSFIYQISLANTPGHPTFSDYYFTGWRVPVLIILTVFLLASIIFFLVRVQAYRKMSPRKMPMLLPLILLSAAFLLNGAFSDTVGTDDLLFGLSQVFSFLFLFVIFSVGLSENDNEERIGSVFAYSSLLLSLLLFSAIAIRYITAWDAIFVDGSIIKEQIVLGWGIWNPIGVSIAVLIPMNFYGAIKTKHRVPYLIGAAAAALGAVMSMSRNAMLFGAAAFVACLAISCFVGEGRRFFRTVTAFGIAALALVSVILWDKISAVLSSGIALGDNGRFEIWGEAMKEFSDHPIFGGGFWSVPSDAFYVTSFMPPFAHQTFVELLAACGIAGLATYLFYRAKSAIPFFCRPTLLKTMLGISILVLLGESLLDNFIFYIYTMIYYNAALSAVFHVDAKSGK